MQLLYYSPLEINMTSGLSLVIKSGLVVGTIRDNEHLYSTSVNRGLVKTARNNTSLVANITLVINIGYRLNCWTVGFFSTASRCQKIITKAMSRTSLFQ